MQSGIDENARMNVEISNLSASPDEVDQLKSIIESNLGSNATTPIVTSMSNTKKGTKYTVAFSIHEPQRFNIDSINDWLHSINLVGWRVDATLVQGDQD